MGFRFKPKLSAILAVIHGASVGLAYIVSQGNITVTIVWFAVSTGVTAGLSYYKEKEQTKSLDLRLSKLKQTTGEIPSQEESLSKLGSFSNLIKDKVWHGLS